MPKVCIFRPALTPETLPSCAPNPDFLAGFAATAQSALAKVDTAAAKYQALCAKHNVSTSEGKAACNADRTNRCYMSFTGHCMSGYFDAVLRDATCQGSAYRNTTVCYAKYKDECNGTLSKPDKDGCVWSDLWWYGGADAYNASHVANEEMMGGPLIYGACGPKGQIEAAVKADGSYDVAGDSAWSDMNAGDPSNITSWIQQRGNCSYAQTALARNKYRQTCDPFNKIIYSVVKVLNVLDYNDVKGCQAAGCTVSWTDGKVLQAQGYDDIPDSVFVCAAASDYFTRSLYYNYPDDGKIVLAAAFCGDPAVQYDQQRCESVTL